MTSNLNIDLLFKKYSEYFAYSQTASTHRHTQEKPLVKNKNNKLQKEHGKSQTVKLKSSKTLKTKLKAENKDTLIETKKTKSGISSKVTPRCQISTKQYDIKGIKSDYKMNKSITPDKIPRKSLSRTPIGLTKKIDKNVSKVHKQNKQKNNKSKSRQLVYPLTDRSIKLKTQRSKSRDGVNGEKNKIKKTKPRQSTIKQPHRVKQYHEDSKNYEYPLSSKYPQYTLQTEYIFNRQSFQQPFEEQRMSFNVPSRSKIRNDQLFYQGQEYQTPNRNHQEKYLDIPIISSRQQKAQITSRQSNSIIQNQIHKQNYYKQLISKMKQQQQQKWLRTINILKQYREIGDKQMLNQIISQSEQNRKSLNINIVNNSMGIKQSRQSKKDQIYQKYKHLYNQDHISSFQSPKQKVNLIKSRQASSKKLLSDLQQSHLNQIQLQNHFSSNKQLNLRQKQRQKQTSYKKLNYLGSRQQIRQLFNDNKSNIKIDMSNLNDMKRQQIEDTFNKTTPNRQLQYHIDNNKQQNLLSTHNVNIQQYLLSQSKKSQSPSPRHQSPSFDRIESKDHEHYNSEENSLIDFIQNQLKEVNEEKKTQYNTVSQTVFQQVFQSQIKLFGKQIMESGEVLHQFLVYTNQNFNQKESQKPKQQIEPIQIPQTIECSNGFILQLVRSFLMYIQNHTLEQFNLALTIPFGQKPIKMLKFMRDSGDNQDNEGGYQSIIPVSLFIEFEPTLKQKVKMASNLQQYFFNHCIFDCINQNLDKIRPFGLKGLPPLCFKTDFNPMRFESVYQYLVINTRSIISFGIGRDIDDCEQQDAFKIIDNTFKKLDKLILTQTDQEWKDNNDLQFELKYDLTIAIAEWIFREEAKVLLNLIL